MEFVNVSLRILIEIFVHVAGKEKGLSAKTKGQTRV